MQNDREKCGCLSRDECDVESDGKSVCSVTGIVLRFLVTNDALGTRNEDEEMVDATEEACKSLASERKTGETHKTVLGTLRAIFVNILSAEVLNAYAKELSRLHDVYAKYTSINCKVFVLGFLTMMSQPEGFTYRGVRICEYDERVAQAMPKPSKINKAGSGSMRRTNITLGTNKITQALDRACGVLHQDKDNDNDEDTKRQKHKTTKQRQQQKQKQKQKKQLHQQQLKKRHRFANQDDDDDDSLAAADDDSLIEKLPSEMIVRVIVISSSASSSSSSSFSDSTVAATTAQAQATAATQAQATTQGRVVSCITSSSAVTALLMG